MNCKIMKWIKILNLIKVVIQIFSQIFQFKALEKILKIYLVHQKTLYKNLLKK